MRSWWKNHEDEWKLLIPDYSFVKMGVNELLTPCFSDGCSLFVIGTVSRDNCRYWSDFNPRTFQEKHRQHPTNKTCGLDFWWPYCWSFFLTRQSDRVNVIGLVGNNIHPMSTDIRQRSHRMISSIARFVTPCFIFVWSLKASKSIQPHWLTAILHVF